MNSDTVFSNEQARHSLEVLAQKMGTPEILTVPIHVFDSKPVGITAYTTMDGIYIAKSVLETEPHNVGGYVAHEILHHVIVDPGLNSLYDGYRLNIAEDYKINQVIQELWGYDVSKYGTKGLRSKKYDRLSLSDTCKAIFPDGTVKGCGHLQTGATHPVVLNVAMSLRKRFHVLEKTRHLKLPKPRVLTPIPEREYEAEVFQVMSRRYKELRFHTDLTNVDVDDMVRILWARFFLPEVTYNTGALQEPMPLTLSETVGIAPLLDDYRERTVLRPNETFMMVLMVLRRVLTFHELREDLINRTKQTLTDYAPSLMLLKGEKLVKAKARIQRLERRLQRYIGFPVLNDLQGPKNYAILKKKKPALVSKLDLRTDPVPAFKATDLVRAIRFIVRYSGKEFKQALDAAGKMESVLTPLTGDGSGGQEAGDSGLGERMDAVEVLESNLAVLHSILAYASDFSEKLSVASSRHTDPNLLVDSTYEYSSDLDRVVPSELARLNNPETRLSFYVDLANSSLLSYVANEPRRGPVIFLLDCSGSMAGKKYAMATGFILAMAKKMVSFGRKTALVRFSHRVVSTTVWGEGDNPTLVSLMKTLATGVVGGTAYDPALEEAEAICAKHSWKNTTVFIITDGDTKADSAIVSRMESSGIKLTAVLVARAGANIGIRDTISVNPTTMETTLVRLGASL